jgi:hypothetical protein
MLHLLPILAALLLETAPDNVDEDEHEGQHEDEEEEVRNPRIRELSAEAKKWRLKYREAQAQLAEMEPADDEGHVGGLQDARLEAAFLREVLSAGHSLDVDTTWDLMRLRGFLDAVKVDDEGIVTGMDEALSKTVDRYPWLSDEPPEAEDRPPAAKPTVGTARKKKDSVPSVNDADLQRRMKALRRGR